MQEAFFDIFMPPRNQSKPGKKISSCPNLDLEFLKGDRLEDKWYYKIAKLLSVFLREILLFYTIIHFLQTPNVFKVLYLASYLYYFVSQIADLRTLVVRYQLKPLLVAKLRYFRNCLVESLAPDRKVTLSDDAELRAAERQMHRVYVHLFAKSMFNAVHRCTKRTWLLLFLTILLYLQVLFMLKLYMAHVVDVYWVEFLFNFDFTDQTLLKQELEKVLFVLAITVFELYFMNILKSKPLSDQESLVHSILSVVVDFYEFRALVKEQGVTLEEKKNETEEGEPEIEKEEKVETREEGERKSREVELITRNNNILELFKNLGSDDFVIQKDPEEKKSEEDLEIEEKERKQSEIEQEEQRQKEEKKREKEESEEQEFADKLQQYEKNIQLSFEKYKRFADEKMAVQLQELFLEDSMNFDSVSEPFSSLITRYLFSPHFILFITSFRI